MTARRVSVVATFGNHNFGHGFGCSNAEFSTISAAVAAANPGATIVVCPGTYVEDVTVEKPLTIVGSAATVAPGSSDTYPLIPSRRQQRVHRSQPVGDDQRLHGRGASGDGLLWSAIMP